MKNARKVKKLTHTLESLSIDPVGRITYIVLAQTLNHAQLSIDGLSLIKAPTTLPLNKGACKL